MDLPFEILHEIQNFKFHARFQFFCYVALFAKSVYQVSYEFFWEDAQINWIYVGLVFGFNVFIIGLLWGILQSVYPSAFWRWIFGYFILTAIIVFFLGQFLYTTYTDNYPLPKDQLRQSIYFEIITSVVFIYLTFLEFQAVCAFFKLVFFCRHMKNQEVKQYIQDLEAQEILAEHMNIVVDEKKSAVFS